MKKISTTSTKNDILEAYEEVLSYLNEQKLENSALKKELQEKLNTVSTAKKVVANADFATAIDDFALQFIKQVDEVKNKFLQEKNNFENIQKAVVIEQANLEDLYKINAQAESLEALLLTNKRIKEKLDADLKTLKENSETDIANSKAAWHNELSEAKLKRAKEDEEFLYKQKIARRNDEDAYAQLKNKLELELTNKREQFDREFEAREAQLSTREDELNDLRKEQKDYQQNILSAVKQAESTITEKLEAQYEYKNKLDNKELEVQIKLFQQEIDLLKLKSNEQQQIIVELNEKSSKASDQVKDIALKAIEGASQSRWSSDKRDENSRKSE